MASSYSPSACEVVLYAILVILFNAFHKKSQKTPKGEIEKAKRIMKAYFEEKKGI
ncbi:MAG: type II toxin-antitoxin system RelE/ParE family toxin [Bacteroidaceae bacterium]|nr:type II toxin-antitoxin system RelE/ParE family toxin [Bacteroidaceae bacterium]